MINMKKIIIYTIVSLFYAIIVGILRYCLFFNLFH